MFWDLKGLFMVENYITWPSTVSCVPKSNGVALPEKGFIIPLINEYCWFIIQSLCLHCLHNFGKNSQIARRITLQTCKGLMGDDVHCHPDSRALINIHPLNRLHRKTKSSVESKQ